MRDVSAAHCLSDPRSQIPDEWKLGKLENSRTTGNSLLARPEGFACAAERGKLPEKHTSHNRKNDGYQSMDRKRPENRDYALGRLNVRDTFSQCESLCAGLPEWWIRAVGRFEKKIRERNQGERNNREEARTIVFALMNHPCQELAMPLPN